MNELSQVPAEVKRLIVDSYQQAVGDDIKEHIASNDWATQNAAPFMIWDFFNTRIKAGAKKCGCEVKTIKSGFYKTNLLYHLKSKVLISAMREERFSSIKGEMVGRTNPHYVDVLIDLWNSDFLVNDQIVFQGFETGLNEEQLEYKTNKIMSDLYLEKDEVSFYAIALLDKFEFSLASARLIVPNMYFDIEKEENLTKLILSTDSVIAFPDESFDTPSSHPEIGLKLKGKAYKKMIKNVALKTKEQSKNNT